MQIVKKQQYDVLIVGAGPGGSAAAIALAKMGWKVLLLEKAHFPRDKVCGDFISPRSLHILEVLGCKQALEMMQPNRLQGATLYLDGQPITRGLIPQMENLANYGYTCPRIVFDEVIFRQAQASGVETLEECEVKNMILHPHGVILEALHQKIPCSFDGKMVIAADGAHSTIARLLLQPGGSQKAGHDPISPAQQWGSPKRSGDSPSSIERRNDSKHTILALRAYFDGVEGDGQTADIFFDQSYFPGYAWIFPMSNGRANVGLGMVMDVYQRYEINLRERFTYWLEHDPVAQARLGHAQLDGRIVGWPLNTYRAEGGNYAERVLLLGDSAHFVDPINGEGIHTALESAFLAAQVANEALFAGDLSAAFLSRYERYWRAAFDLDMRTADWIVTIIKNRSLTAIWLLVLKMIAQKALDDQKYAATCGGILSGVVPTHHSLSPNIIVKTLMHNPSFWLDNLGVALDQGLPGLMDSGLLLANGVLSTVNQMVREPGPQVEWGVEVATKGLNVLSCLGKTYSDDLLMRTFNDCLRAWLSSNGKPKERI